MVEVVYTGMVELNICKRGVLLNIIMLSGRQYTLLLNLVLPSVALLNVVLLSDFMLNVVAPYDKFIPAGDGDGPGWIKPLSGDGLGNGVG
jgi:hypothetical protein